MEAILEHSRRMGYRDTLTSIGCWKRPDGQSRLDLGGFSALVA
jgi:hypothetical protein